jgi:hypothetical protein
MIQVTPKTSNSYILVTPIACVAWTPLQSLFSSYVQVSVRMPTSSILVIKWSQMYNDKQDFASKLILYRMTGSIMHSMKCISSAMHAAQSIAYVDLCQSTSCSLVPPSYTFIAFTETKTIKRWTKDNYFCPPCLAHGTLVKTIISTRIAWRNCQSLQSNSIWIPSKLLLGIVEK